MLNAHRQVAVPPESRFIVELWQGKVEVAVDRFLASLAAHNRFQMWDLPIEMVREELPERGDVRYADAIEAAYVAYARIQGKTRWGDKTPRYIEHIPLLARLFPKARFVHLVRDGRNVALSYSAVPFGPNNVAQAAVLWARRVGAGIRDGRGLGDGRYLEMRYEDLVEDAGGEAKMLCQFLDLDFDPEMLNYTERARAAVLPRAKRYNPHVMEKPMQELRSWERDLPERHVELFEAIAGTVLAELGYPRRYPAPSATARVLASLGKIGLPFGRLRPTSGADHSR